MSNIDSIKIRMYNTGSVGDCFLLLFYKKEVLSFSMLIDCGGFKTKKDFIQKCVADIKLAIDNKSIDLVVVTHEHEDHVSGFNQARDLFKDIEFKQVWMSWAENDDDPLAKKLLKEKGKKVKALLSIIRSNLKKVEADIASSPVQRGLNRSLGIRKQNFENALSILEFEEIHSLASPGVSYKVADAMKYVKGKSKSKDKKKMFHSPGEVLTMKGAEGIKFYILGPPYDQDLHGIKNDEDPDQMYSLARRLGLNINNFYFNAIAALSDSDATLNSPFGAKYKMSPGEVRYFKEKHYNQEWRKIEYDWIDTAGDLAIALTDFVNNTSLAMAIEFKDSGKVLLFPADAQSGNWMSWFDESVKKALNKNGGNNADILLENTVFYKVGHHGSHNGTASKAGLEKMKDHKFIAFMPLIQDKVPTQWGGAKNFPAKALYKELIEKTRGAIIRTDEGLITDDDAAELRKKHFSAEEIKRLKDASKNPLYHEWIIKG